MRRPTVCPAVLAAILAFAVPPAAQAQLGPVAVVPETAAFPFGKLQLTVLRDAAANAPNDAKVFGVDAGVAAVEKVLEDAGAPAGQISLSVNVLLVRLPGHVVLVDTGYGTPRGILLASLAKAGIAPAAITDVLITHGHGDHYGGAQMIADRYRARVVASEIDWKMMETGLEFDSKLWDRPPKRDMSVKDGETLKLGDTTIRFIITPGHTLGTISPVFDVRHGGKVHKVMIWGGTSFNFGRDMLRLDGYIAQTERMRKLAAEWGIDVPLSNHPGFDGTVAKLKARAAAPGAANPFVSGQPVVDRAMRVLNTCARAQKARFLMTASGGTKDAYASTGTVVESLADAPPRLFPYSAVAEEHGGFCGHVEAQLRPGRSASVITLADRR